MAEIVGKLLRGHFQVISCLGGGGGGDTFVAVDIDRPGHPKCVVKRFKPPYNAPHLLLNARTLFNREAETLERLGRMHGQIPMLLAYFEEDEEFYLVQEFIEGRTLVGELPVGHRWSEAKVVRLLKDVLSILQFVHSEGVIHRDLKPANLIRQQKDGKLVLIDFGAVKRVRGENQTQFNNLTSISVGTEGYMPPEQWMGKPYPSSDIYALGMIGIQALTGTEPTQLDRDADGEVIWRFKTSVNGALADVLSKMVRYHFRGRYQSATEVLQTLQGINQDQILSTLPKEIDSGATAIDILEEFSTMLPHLHADYDQSEQLWPATETSKLHSQLTFPQKEVLEANYKQPTNYSQEEPKEKFETEEKSKVNFSSHDDNHRYNNCLEITQEIPETKYSSSKASSSTEAKYSYTTNFQDNKFLEKTRFRKILDFFQVIYRWNEDKESPDHAVSIEPI